MKDSQRKAIHANAKRLKYADPKKVKEFDRAITIGEHMLNHRDNLRKIGVKVVTHNRDIQKQSVKINRLAKEIGLPSAR